MVWRCARAARKEVPEADTLLLVGGGIGGLATWLGWQWRKIKPRRESARRQPPLSSELQHCLDRE